MDSQWQTPNHVIAAKQDFDTCFGELAAGYAITTYHDLEPLVAPDSLTSKAPGSGTVDYLTQQAAIQSRIDKYLDAESAISNSITSLSKPPTPAVGAATNYSVDEETFITALSVYQKIIDAVRADLAGYDQRIKDLGPCGYSDPDSRVSNTFCWDKASRYSLGNLALQGDDFYIRVNDQPCTPGVVAKQCMDPKQDATVWKRPLPPTSNISAISIQHPITNGETRLRISVFGGPALTSAITSNNLHSRPGLRVQLARDRHRRSTSNLELTIIESMKTWSLERLHTRWTL
jgi:hypothetical protein